MNITQTKADDIPTLISLQKQLEKEDVIFGYRADSEEDWTKRCLEWSFVASENSNLVGFIYCCPRKYEGECLFSSDSQILEIVEFFVIKEFRHCGIGHKLVKMILKVASKNGFTNLRLYSAAKRFDNIVSFYRKCGFVPWYLEMTMKIEAEQIDGADKNAVLY